MQSLQDLRKVAIMQLMENMIQDDELRTQKGIFRINGSVAKVSELVGKIESNEKIDFSLLDKTIKTSLLKKLIKDFDQSLSAQEHEREQEAGHRFVSKESMLAIATIILSNDADNQQKIKAIFEKEMIRLAKLDIAERTSKDYISELDILIKLTELLNKLAEYHNVTEMPLSNLAICMAPNILYVELDELEGLEPLALMALAPKINSYLVDLMTIVTEKNGKDMFFRDELFIQSVGENLEAALQHPGAQKVIQKCIDGEDQVGPGMSRVLNLLGGKVVDKETFEREFAIAGGNPSVYLHGTLAVVEAIVLDGTKQKLSDSVINAIGREKYDELVAAIVKNDETVEDQEQAERAIATAFMQAVITEYSQCLSKHNALSSAGKEEKEKYDSAFKALKAVEYEVICSVMEPEHIADIDSDYLESNTKDIPFTVKDYEKLSQAMGTITEGNQRSVLSTFVDNWNQQHGNTTDEQREQGQQHVFNQIINNVEGNDLGAICQALEACNYGHNISKALKEDIDFQSLKDQEKKLHESANYPEEKELFTLKYIVPFDYFSDQYQAGELNIYKPREVPIPSMEGEGNKEDLGHVSPDAMEYIGDSEPLLPNSKNKQDSNAKARSTARKAGAIAGALLYAGIGAVIGTFFIPIPGVGTTVGAIIGGLIGGAAGVVVGGGIGLGVAEGTIQAVDAFTVKKPDVEKGDGYNNSHQLMAKAFGGSVEGPQQKSKLKDASSQIQISKLPARGDYLPVEQEDSYEEGEEHNAIAGLR